MKQILLLTKNLFLDVEWQNKLQTLGYEVYCSYQFLNRILAHQDVYVFNLFDVIIFSETIANEEVTTVLELSCFQHIHFFRIGTPMVTSPQLDGEEQELPIDYLTFEMSLSDLREALTKIKEEKIIAHYFTLPNGGRLEDIPPEKMDLLFLSLSKREKQLFDILFERRGQCVTRMELSQLLWNKEASQSTLSQLSQITRRLKEKIQIVGLNDSLVHTDWKKGYSLRIS